MPEAERVCKLRDEMLTRIVERPYSEHRRGWCIGVPVAFGSELTLEHPNILGGSGVEVSS